jgi:pimeloyl-ACP methyl ester carboxylesterase
VRVDEHTIELAGSPVFFRTAPASGPPPLYLHGMPTSSDDWTGVLEQTGGIAPDLIGFGRSGKGGHLEYTLTGLAEQLERLLDHLGIDRFQLVAHQWGAAVGLLVAQRRPEHVERIVLCNPLPLFEPFHWPLAARIWHHPLLGELAMGATTKWMLKRSLRRGSSNPEHAWPPERLAAIWQQFDQGTQRAILRLHRATDEAALARAGADLSELTQPALVLWGDQDPWLAPRIASSYASALPNAETEHLAGAGHWPWLDEPRAVEMIETFLR